MAKRSTPNMDNMSPLKLILPLALASLHLQSATAFTPSPSSSFSGIGSRIKQPYFRSIRPFARRNPLHATPNSNSNEDNEEEPDIESVFNDQREGMADAFAALDKLTADDFEDLTPVSFSPMSEDATDPIMSRGQDNVNFEESAKLYMDMQAELSDMGEVGLYNDILDDLASSDENAGNVEKKDFRKSEYEEEETLLGKALDEAALADADGIGNMDADSSEMLTTADVTNDVLNQDIQPSLSMDEFMNKAVEEAISDIATASSKNPKESSTEEENFETRPMEIAATAQKLLQDESLRKEIEEIFDKAEIKLKAKVEEMKKEQERVTQEASKKGLDYLESEKQRLAEAEESVSRLIQKVAKETNEVEKAMADLERVKNEAGTGNGGLEDTALDLKKGGLVKQASLVGGLLFGSRAFTETILVLGSSNGEDHVFGAVGQAAIALVCAAYFFLAK